MLFSRFIIFAVISAFAMVFNVAMATFPPFITSTQYVNWNQNVVGFNTQYNCVTFNQQPLFYSDNQFFYEYQNTRYYVTVQGGSVSPNNCLTYPVNTWRSYDTNNGYPAWTNGNFKIRYNGGWTFFG